MAGPMLAVATLGLAVNIAAFSVLIELEGCSDEAVTASG